MYSADGSIVPDHLIRYAIIWRKPSRSRLDISFFVFTSKKQINFAYPNIKKNILTWAGGRSGAVEVHTSASEYLPKAGPRLFRRWRTRRSTARGHCRAWVACPVAASPVCAYLQDRRKLAPLLSFQVSVINHVRWVRRGDAASHFAFIFREKSREVFPLRVSGVPWKIVISSPLKGAYSE